MSSKKLLEQAAGAPAYILDKTIDTSKQITELFISKKHIGKAKNYWKSLGPGLTTGAADDDPSGITTYSQAGAAYGFNLLWLSAFTFPLMAIVQEMCARIGLVTGRGLAANIRQYYPKWVLLFATSLLFFANTLNIGGPSIPSIITACSRCGYLSQHALGVLGLLPNKTEKKKDNKENGKE